MATAMQGETTVSQRKETASERLFAEAILKKDDTSLKTLIEVLLAEEVERRAVEGFSIKVRALHAIELLKQVPAECEGAVTVLRSAIIEAWLACIGDDETVFLRVMLMWPTADTKSIANVLRTKLERNRGDVLQKLTRFLIAGEIPRNENDDLWRTVSKAVGRYTRLADMKLIASILTLTSAQGTEVRDLVAKPLVDYTKRMIVLALLAARVGRSVATSANIEVRGENRIAFIWSSNSSFQGRWPERELTWMNAKAEEIRSLVNHYDPGFRLVIDLEARFSEINSDFNAKPKEILTLKIEV